MSTIAGAAGPAPQTFLSESATQLMAAQSYYARGTDNPFNADGVALAASSSACLAGDERWQVAGDARIDNRGELGLALGMDGAGASDAALILQAWSRWQEKALDRLVGDFAFAVFDRTGRRLFLARDPTGQRPLFYRRQNGGLAFASTPAAFRALGAGRALDRKRLAEALVSAADTGSQSFFQGIERVLPGELVRFGDGGLERRLYWQPSLDWSRIRGEDLVEEYRNLLDEAVGCRLRGSARPVACQLSAGYDSSAVTATAARLTSPAEVVAFTSAPAPGFNGDLPRARIADESVIATETAVLLGIRHEIVRDMPPLFDVIRRHSRLVQEPILSPYNLAWWVEIRRRARDLGADTLLTGELGNLTLNAGGVWSLPDWLGAGEWGRWWRQARAAARRSDVSWRGILFNSFGSRLPASVWLALRRRHLDIRPLADSSFLRPEWRRQMQSQTGRQDQPTGNSYRDRLHAIRQNDVGMLRKASTADCGIDERDPTSDRRLIEFSLTLQPEQLLCDGVSRPLARRALADRVPESVLDLPGRGLQAADWHTQFHRAEAEAVLEEIASNPTVADLLDVAQMRQAIADWPVGDWNGMPTIARYRLGLTNALATGLFVKEWEG